MTDGCDDLARLRRQRETRERDLSIGGLVRAAADSATTSQRKMGKLIEAWDREVPGDLARHTRIVSVRGGNATVHVDSAPVLYELDRFLRTGGLERLRRGYAGPLARVRLKRAETAAG